MLNASDELKYIFRMILLLDKNYEPDLDKRLDKAFRHFGSDPADMELFDDYVRGGVEVLHEKLIQGAAGEADVYTGKLYDFVEEFNDRFNSEVTPETILNLCNQVNQ